MCAYHVFHLFPLLPIQSPHVSLSTIQILRKVTTNPNAKRRKWLEYANTGNWNCKETELSTITSVTTIDRQQQEHHQCLSDEGAAANMEVLVLVNMVAGFQRRHLEKEKWWQRKWFEGWDVVRVCNVHIFFNWVRASGIHLH